MSTKKILIINGHPDTESFNYALSNAYKEGAIQSGAEVREINIGSLNFEISLKFGYRKRMQLEPDLIEAQEKIKWAEHTVWVYPVWWGSIPAVMKGFLDRVLLPGFAFEHHKNSVWWDKLLTGKTARLVSTLDQPLWYYWLVYRKPSHNAMKKIVLQFCGISPVKTTTIGPINVSKEVYREKWLRKIKKLGLQNI